MRYVPVVAILALSLALSPLFSSSLPVNTSVIAKGVVFLYDDNNRVGTGFVVAIPPIGKSHQIYVAIVTARHMVDPEWFGCPWPDPRSLLVTANTKDYKPNSGDRKVEQYTIPLRGADGQRTWYSHLDPRVDAAVIPIPNGDLLSADVAPLAISEFATKEEIEKFKIGIGDGVISAGLVPQLLAVEARNYPAFKFGKVSSVPDEPIESRCSETSPPRPLWAWVVAANFVPGNSGSPIFLLPTEFTLAPPLQFNGPRPMILGLFSSTVRDADLGLMVPIEYVFEIIQQNFPKDADLYRGAPKNEPASNSKETKP